MISHSQRTYASAYTFYSQGSQYQLWGHLEPASLLLQLRTFFPNGAVKIFKNSIREIVNQNAIINFKILFEELKSSPPTVPDPKKGSICIQIKKVGFLKKGTVLQLNLNQVQNQPSLDNWMLFNLYNQKIQQKQKEQLFQGNWSTEDQVYQYLQPKPIEHQNDRYKFTALLDMIARQITTELIVKESGKYKDKSYKSKIKESDWSQEYRKQFQKIQNLFEHLRKHDNYQVLETKGLIKIKNQPVLKGNVEFQKKCSKKFLTQRKNMEKDYEHSSSKKNFTTEAQLLKINIEKDLLINRELTIIEQKLENKLLTYIKSCDKQINSKQKQSSKKIMSNITNMEKEIKKQMKKVIQEEIGNLRLETLRAIEQLKKIYQSKSVDGKANMRKSHFFGASSKALSSEGMQYLKINNNAEDQKNKLAVNPKSSQIQNFNIEAGSNIIYKGSWDWTQLFTNLKIDFTGVHEFKIKIKSTLFSAIAIGVSGIQNYNDRSSLAKKDSISYWGDGEIWEKQKIKQEGSGFKVGDTVMTRVDRNKGQINWLVNQAIKSKYTSKMLSNKQVQIYAYFEMYDQGDQLELLSYRIL